MPSHISVVMFAEVDQTFLDDADQRSAEVGETFIREDITVVLSSSMTRAELEMGRQALGIRQPFICESGAAVLIPDGCFPFDVPCDRELKGYRVIEFGIPYARIVAALRKVAVRTSVSVVGFNDLSVEQVANDCGMSLLHARLAKLREYDEPFRLPDAAPDARRRLWKGLHAAGLGCTHHASFEHVGAPVDRSAAFRLLAGLYRRALGTIAPVCLGSVATSVTFPRGVTQLYQATDRIAWMETIVELARRARERHRSQFRVSAAE